MIEAEDLICWEKAFVQTGWLRTRLFLSCLDREDSKSPGVGTVPRSVESFTSTGVDQKR